MVTSFADDSATVGAGVGQLALGSIADRVDVGNPRVRYGVHGLRAASSSASTGRARSPLPACVRARHWRYYGTGNALAALHATEAAIWAAAVWLGALGSLEAAILYSVNSMCTRGASGIMLRPTG